MMQELCFIAIARTGTNHLVNVLSGLPLVKARAEVFHPQAAWGLSQWERAALIKHSNIEFTGNDDPALVTYVRDHPQTLLEVLSKDNGKHHLMCFKIFPGHLTFPSIEQNLIARPSLHFITIKRRAIDSYISNRKAEMVGQYTHANTTNLAIEIDINHFIKTYQANQRWYDDIEAMTERHHRVVGHMQYETDIDGPIEHMIAAVKREALLIGLDPSSLDGSSSRGLPKQDNSSSYADKISNWTEFARELKQRGLFEAVIGRY